LLDNVFYLHASDDFGLSGLAAVHRKLGQSATARTSSTIQSLIEMFDAESSE
jgi:hypothetical protein